MFGVQTSCGVELCTLRLGNAKLTTFKSHDVAVNMAEKHWFNTMWTLWHLNHCHMNCRIMWVKYGKTYLDKFLPHLSQLIGTLSVFKLIIESLINSQMATPFLPKPSPILNLAKNYLQIPTLPQALLKFEISLKLLPNQVRCIRLPKSIDIERSKFWRATPFSLGTFILFLVKK